MKRFAFTMIELVFVIVVIGILSAVIVPRMQRDPLTEAAIQLASHIRYTQHLAMVDDKYVPSPSMSKENTTIRKRENAKHWFRGRWQLVFGTSADTNNKIAYTIFSDQLGSGDLYSGQPDKREIAKNPLDSNKVLSGGYSAGNIDSTSALASKEMNLGNKYDIIDVDFTGGCNIATNKERLFFDHLGRPFYGSAHLQTSPYKDETNAKLLRTNCIITLTHRDTSTIDIVIRPETGYVSIDF